MGKLSDISKSLGSLLSGYRSQQELNTNFDNISDVFEDRVLWRDNPAGNANQMENELDMNSNKIINLGAPVASNDAARLIDITSQLELSAGAASIGSLTGQSGNPVVVNGTEDGLVAGDAFDSCRVVASTTAMKALTGYDDGDAVIVGSSTSAARLFVMDTDAASAFADADTLAQFRPDDALLTDGYTGRQRWVQIPITADVPPPANIDPNTNAINLAVYGVTDGDVLWNGDATDTSMPFVQALADMAASGMNTVYIPPGTYSITSTGGTSTLEFAADTTVFVKGAGIDSTIIQVPDGTTENLGTVMTFNCTDGGGISDLTIEATGDRLSSANTNDRAVYFDTNTSTDNVKNVVVENIKLKRERGTGIQIKHPINCIVRNIICEDVNQGSIYLQGTESGTPTVNGSNNLIEGVRETFSATYSPTTANIAVCIKVGNDLPNTTVRNVNINDAADPITAGLSGASATLITSNSAFTTYDNFNIDFDGGTASCTIIAAQLGTGADNSTVQNMKITNVETASGAINNGGDNVLIRNCKIDTGGAGTCIVASAASTANDGVYVDVDADDLTTSGTKISYSASAGDQPDYGAIGASASTGRPMFVEGLYELVDSSVLTGTGVTSVAHNAGRVPDLYTISLVCAVADNGYSPGDEVPMGGSQLVTALTAQGNVFIDANNFGITSTTAFELEPKGGGAPTPLGASDWKLRLRSWCFATSN